MDQEYYEKIIELLWAERDNLNSRLSILPKDILNYLISYLKVSDFRLVNAIIDPTVIDNINYDSGNNYSDSGNIKYKMIWTIGRLHIIAEISTVANVFGILRESMSSDGQLFATVVKMNTKMSDDWSKETNKCLDDKNYIFTIKNENIKNTNIKNDNIEPSLTKLQKCYIIYSEENINDKISYLVIN